MKQVAVVGNGILKDYTNAVNSKLEQLAGYEVIDIKHAQTDFEGEAWYTAMIIYEVN